MDVQAKIINAIEAIMKHIDDAYKEKNMEKLALYIRQLRLFSSNTKNPDEFPYKEIYHTQAHLVIIICLSKTINMENTEVIDETLWMISNMMLAPKHYLTEFLKGDIIVKLTQYLDIKHTKWFRSIFWSLSNIIAELPEVIHKIIENGFVDFLLNNVDHLMGNFDNEHIIAWFISNIFRQKGKINSRIMFSILDKYFPIFFSEINSESLPEILTAINDFLIVDSNDFYERCELVMDKNPLERMIELGYSKNMYMRNLILEIIGKISINEK